MARERTRTGMGVVCPGRRRGPGAPKAPTAALPNLGFGLADGTGEDGDVDVLGLAKRRDEGGRRSAGRDKVAGPRSEGGEGVELRGGGRQR
jgi:hypothetical protein